MKKFTLFLFALICSVSTWAKTEVSNVSALADGTYITLQCMDLNGGDGYYFDGAAAKSASLKYGSIYKVVANGSAFNLQRVSDGKYVACAGNNSAVTMADSQSGAAAFTFSIASATGWTTVTAENLAKNGKNTVRFTTSDTYLNTQTTAAVPAYKTGTGGFSIWDVYTYTDAEVQELRDAAVTFADGDYFFYNVEAGGWLGGANWWSTQASTVKHPQRYTLAKVSDGVYTIDSHTWNNATNHYLNGNYIDGGAVNCTLTKNSDGTYALVSGSTPLGGVAGSDYSNYNSFKACTTDGTGNSWVIYSLDDMINNLENYTEEDATFLIKDASLNRNLYNRWFDSAWEVTADNYTQYNGTEWWGNMASESWCSAFDVYQDINNVPNGKYTLKAQAAITDYTGAYDGTDYPVVYANDVTAPFVNMVEADRGTSMSQLNGSFDKEMYPVSLDVVVTDGTLRVGVKGTRTDTWCMWDNFELTKYIAKLGDVTSTPANDFKLSESDLTQIEVSYPDNNLLEGYTAKYSYTLTEDGTEIAAGEGALDPASLVIPVTASTGHTYELTITTTTYDPAGEKMVEKTETISGRTLNKFELAVAAYEDAVKAAEDKLAYAKNHMGNGLLLYYPAQVAKYEKNLKLAESLGEDYATYNDYVEGKALMMEVAADLTPQLPKVNQRYILTQNSSNCVMNIVNGTDVKVTETATPVMFHHIEGAGEDAVYYMYSTQDRKYVYYTGDDTWSITNEKTRNKYGQWSIKLNETTGLYNIVGMYGALGSDATESGSLLYADKGANAANSQWSITEYTEPVITDETLKAGDYYIRNRESGTYFGGANSWGTQASLVETPSNFTAALIEDGVYTLDSHTYNSASQHFVGNANYIDANVTNLSITPTGDGYYTISVDDKYYSAPASGTVLDLGAYADKKSEWQFLTKEQMLAEVEAGESDDLSFLIKDASISRNLYNASYENAWEGDSFSKGGDNTNQNAEKWGGNSETFDVHQTIELPNGIYHLSCNGYYRYNNTTDNTTQVAFDTHADGTEVINSFLYANDVQTPLMSIADESAQAVLGTTADALPFSQSAASAAFAKGLYVNDLIVEVTDGTLTFGIKKTSHPGCDWTVWDNFQLTPATDAEAAIYAAVRAAQATGISSTASTAASAPVAVYSMNGTQLRAAQKGLNIVKMADGQTKKVFIK